MKKIISLLTVLLLVLSLTVPAFAEDTTIGSIGAKALSEGYNTENAPTVYFNGTKWITIGYNESGVGSASNTAALISSDILTKSVYNEKEARSNIYSTSVIKGVVDGYVPEGAEKEAIAVKTIKSAKYNMDKTDGTNGDPVDTLYWLLTTAEAWQLNSTIKRTPDLSVWYLCSPGYSSSFAAVVDGPSVNYGGVNAYMNYGVRPGVQLKLDSILFTTPAANEENANKLTLKDSSHNSFKVENAQVNNNKLSVDFSGAVTGNNEKISYIVADGNGNISDYKQIENASQAAGSVTFDIPSVPEGSKLYVINEQVNGANASNFASSLCEIDNSIIAGALSTSSTLSNGNIFIIAGVAVVAVAAVVVLIVVKKKKPAESK